jgi:hypothetical protein
MRRKQLTVAIALGIDARGPRRGAAGIRPREVPKFRANVNFNPDAFVSSSVSESIKRADDYCTPTEKVGRSLR